MTKETKNDIQTWSAVGMLVSGVGFAIAGFIVPPIGIIDDSVLWIFAQCLIYTGSVFGFNVYIQRKLTEIESDLKGGKDEKDH
ncbi:hypothetical protein [Segatella bryantii]|jgi:hypothetical protein|uniref:hypothetical protein n=1 Tax=Segatella bryantii TaxID=77095 RepID=UPI00088425E9|nr:hypothetical protein [Segatella bryantii]SDM07744.1 hypothetical protein SAMN04487899_1183 [Segatella bryantii]